MSSMPHRPSPMLARPRATTKGEPPATRAVDVWECCAWDLLSTQLTSAVNSGKARIAGCPCRTVLRGAMAGVGLVSKRDRRRRRGGPRFLLPRATICDTSATPRPELYPIPPTGARQHWTTPTCLTRPTAHSPYPVP
jgi:hypothetical protein